MAPVYYTVVWTDSHCMIGCWHEHKTIWQAVACMPSAGAYVVGVEDGVTRALTAEEEAEYSRSLPTCEPQLLSGEESDLPARQEAETLIEFVMRWLDRSEVDELRRMFDESVGAWLRSRRKRP